MGRSNKVANIDNTARSSPNHLQISAFEGGSNDPRIKITPSATRNIDFND